MSPHDRPLVTVGIPVFNGEATIARALTSIARQTVEDLEIIVTDNASTDRTAAICQSHGAHDRRITVIRQPKNLGAPLNFAAALEAARAPYFMWAAADDVWEPTFVEANLSALQGDERLVASISRVRFLGTPGSCDDLGTRPLRGTVEDRLETYLARPGPNSRFYALYRRDVLRQSMVTKGFLAWDWTVVARTLTFGDHGRIDAFLLARESRGESQDLSHVIRTYNRGLGKVLPLLPFTKSILLDRRIPKTWRLCLALGKHNLGYLVALTRQPFR